MAITVTPLGDGVDVLGRRRVLYADITLDASYPTGGYALSAAPFGLKGIIGMQVLGGNTASGPYEAFYNTQTGNLQVFYSPGGTSPPAGFVEVPNGTNLSAVTFRFLIISVSD
jgi:hypothetical protein